MVLDDDGEWHCVTKGCSKCFTQKDKETQRAVLQKVLEKSFEAIYNNIKDTNITEEVDRLGLDRFIHKCARYASASGFVAGAGGFLSMAAALPLDIINTVAQHFRVVKAVVYAQTGNASIPYERMMKLVGISLGVRAGSMVIGGLVAREIIKRLVVLAPTKAIPFFGGFAGAGINYGYIFAVGKALQAADLT
jgi:hypothetical protein